MWSFGVKSNCRGVPTLRILDVVLLALAHGHLRTRDAGHPEHRVVERLAGLEELGLEPLDLAAHLPGLLDELRPLLRGRLRDGRGERVLPGAPLVEASDVVASDAVCLEEGRDVEGEALVGDGGANDVCVLADEGDVEHGARLVSPATW